jgi:hypothetical protein
MGTFTNMDICNYFYFASVFQRMEKLERGMIENEANRNKR